MLLPPTAHLPLRSYVPGTSGKDRLFCYTSPLSLLDQQNLPESLLRPGVHRSSSREMKLISHVDLGYKPLSPRTPTTDFWTNYERGHLPPLIIKASVGCSPGAGSPGGMKQEGTNQQLRYQAQKEGRPSTCATEPDPQPRVYPYMAITERVSECRGGPIWRTTAVQTQGLPCRGYPPSWRALWTF